MLPKGSTFTDQTATAVAVADVSLSSRIRTVRSFFKSLYPGPRSKITWRRYLWNSLVQERYAFCWFDSERPAWSVLGFIEMLAKLWVCFLLATVIVYVFYTDDNSCQNIIDFNECMGEKTFLGTQNKCRWVQVNESCALEEHLDKAPLVVILIQIVTFVSTFLGVFVHKTVGLLVSEMERRLTTPGFAAMPVAILDEHLALEEKKKSLSSTGSLFQRHSGAKVAVANIPASNDPTGKNGAPKIEDVDNHQLQDEFDYDEFTDLQTKRRLMLRAARVTKIMRVSDLVTTEQEAKYVQRIIDRKIKIIKPIDAAMSFAVFIAQLPRVLGFYDKHLEVWNEKKLQVKMEKVAESAREITHMLAQTQSLKDRERLLVLSFMLEIIPAVYHPLIFHILREAPNTRDIIEIYDQHNNTASGIFHLLSVAWKYIWSQVRLFVGVFVLLALFGGGGYAAYLMGLELGSKSVPLWLVLFFLPAVEHIVIVDFLQVLCVHVGLKYRVLTEVYHVLWVLLRDRARLAMMRTSGILRRSLMSVQHLNAACRVARANPSWPISRYLISFNDNDVAPLLDPSHRYNLKDETITVPSPGDTLHLFALPWIGMLRFMSFGYCNWFVGFLLNILVNGIVVGVYTLSTLGRGSVLLYVPMIVLVILTVGIIIREVILYRDPTSYKLYYGRYSHDTSPRSSLLREVLNFASKHRRKVNEVAVEAVEEGEDADLAFGTKDAQSRVSSLRRRKPGSVYQEKSMDDDQSFSTDSEEEDREVQDFIRKSGLVTKDKHTFKVDPESLKLAAARNKYQKLFPGLRVGNYQRDERKTGDDDEVDELDRAISATDAFRQKNNQFHFADSANRRPISLVDVSPQGTATAESMRGPTAQVNTIALAHSESLLFAGNGFGRPPSPGTGDEAETKPFETAVGSSNSRPTSAAIVEGRHMSAIARQSRPVSAQVVHSRPISANASVQPHAATVASEDNNASHPPTSGRKVLPPIMGSPMVTVPVTLGRPGESKSPRPQVQETERDREEARLNRALRHARSRLQPRDGQSRSRSRRTPESTPTPASNRPMAALTAVLRERAELRENQTYDRRNRARRRYDNEYDSVGSDDDDAYNDDGYVYDDEEEDNFSGDDDDYDNNRPRRTAPRSVQQTPAHQGSFHRPRSALPTSQSPQVSPSAMVVRPFSAMQSPAVDAASALKQQQETIAEEVAETVSVASSSGRPRSFRQSTTSHNIAVTNRQRQRSSRMFQARQPFSASNVSSAVGGNRSSRNGGNVRPGPGGHSAEARDQPFLQPPRQNGFRVVTQHHHHHHHHHHHYNNSDAPTTASSALPVASTVNNEMPGTPRHIDDDQMAMVAHFQDEYAPVSSELDSEQGGHPTGLQVITTGAKDAALPMPFTPMTSPPRNPQQGANDPTSLTNAPLSIPTRRDTLRNRRRINRQAYQRAQQQRAAMSETDDPNAVPLFAEAAAMRRENLLAHEMDDGLLVSLRPSVAATAPALPQYDTAGVGTVPSSLVRVGSQRRPQTAGTIGSTTGASTPVNLNNLSSSNLLANVGNAQSSRVVVGHSPSATMNILMMRENQQQRSSNNNNNNNNNDDNQSAPLPVRPASSSSASHHHHHHHHHHVNNNSNNNNAVQPQMATTLPANFFANNNNGQISSNMPALQVRHAFGTPQVSGNAIARTRTMEEEQQAGIYIDHGEEDESPLQHTVATNNNDFPQSPQYESPPRPRHTDDRDRQTRSQGRSQRPAHNSRRFESRGERYYDDEPENEAMDA